MARAAGQHRPEANIRSWELDLAPRGRRQADRMTDGLLVGELAAKSGVGRKALRLCEARRIVPTPGRTAAGYRLYPPDTVHLLAFVGRARRLGLTLSEVAHIVALRRAGSPPCVHVLGLLKQKASDLEGMLRELRGILRSWRADDGRAAIVCPYIEAKGGDVTWTRLRFRSARTAITARRSSSKATRSGSVEFGKRAFFGKPGACGFRRAVGRSTAHAGSGTHRS